MRGNKLYNNKCNFEIGSIGGYHDIDTSNTVDGKPIYYLTKKSDMAIPENAGYVRLISCDNITVKNLDIRNNDDGISFYKTNNSIVTNNKVSDCTRGIYISRSNNLTIINNKISCFDRGILLSSTNDNSIISNSITSVGNKKWRTGISFSSPCRNNKITNNVIFSNERGIGIGQGNYNNYITNNNIIDNGYGVTCFERSSGNYIYHNNFIDNALQTQIYYRAHNYWDDGYPSGGNYWSDHTCTGNPSDGSQPYIIDENNIDHFPFEDPYGWLGNKTLTITDTKTDKSNYTQNETVTISCNLKDDKEDHISADSVNAKITKPDDSIGWVFLDEEETGRYKGNFSDTDLIGDYDVTIYADKVGYVGDTAELGFGVRQNKPPIAVFTYSPEKPMVGGRITFNASSSYDPDGNITNYKWNFGDGNITPTENATITHIYKHPDIYNVTLTVTDNDGFKNSTSKDIDLSLKPGDLLLCRSPGSIVPGFWTHVGMYIGDDKIVEALPKPGVTNTSLTDWSYPNKTCVEALRIVSADDEIRNKAVSFALDQVNKPYDWCWWQKDADGEAWYCSELVWAAYLNASSGTINIEYGPDITGITPTEIDLDDDTERIGEHKERVPKRGFWIITKSPVDLSVTDPDDLSINKESIGISGAIYGEDDIDDDGDPDDWIGIPERKIGNYLITVIPEPDAAPTDTYTLGVSTEDTTTVLAENVSVSEIPTGPYIFESKALTFDTGSPANPYPSIFGTHNGTIKPNQTITVNKLYTYPCAGTGGHTEYARIWNSTLDVNATWNGYKGDWHNISFNKTFTLVANEKYNYTAQSNFLVIES